MPVTTTYPGVYIENYPARSARSPGYRHRSRPSQGGHRRVPVKRSALRVGMTTNGFSADYTSRAR